VDLDLIPSYEEMMAVEAAALERAIEETAGYYVKDAWNSTKKSLAPLETSSADEHFRGRCSGSARIFQAALLDLRRSAGKVRKNHCKAPPMRAVRARTPPPPPPPERPSPPRILLG
jgi:hypothetical protein